MKNYSELDPDILSIYQGVISNFRNDYGHMPNKNYVLMEVMSVAAKTGFGSVIEKHDSEKYLKKFRIPNEVKPAQKTLEVPIELIEEGDTIVKNGKAVKVVDVLHRLFAEYVRLSLEGGGYVDGYMRKDKVEVVARRSTA